MCPSARTHCNTARRRAPDQPEEAMYYTWNYSWYYNYCTGYYSYYYTWNYWY
jgi:hypothetical protein